MSPAGPSAAKGSWSDDHTFVLNRLILGAGLAEQKYILSFEDEKLRVRGRDRNGREVSVDGGTWRKS